MRIMAGMLFAIAAMTAGCSEHARIFADAKIGMPASQVRGLQDYTKGGVFLANDRRLISSYPGQEPDLPEGPFYGIVINGDGIIVAKGYRDMGGQDRFFLVMRRGDLEEFQKVQEQIGVSATESEHIVDSWPFDPDRPVPQNTRLASGVMAHDWGKFSDCLMGWPFVLRSNDLRSYAAHGGEIPWDEFLARAKGGDLNVGCQDDLIGIRGRSPSGCVVGGYSKLFGLPIGGTASTQHPANWRE